MTGDLVQVNEMYNIMIGAYYIPLQSVHKAYSLPRQVVLVWQPSMLHTILQRTTFKIGSGLRMRLPT